MKLASFLGSYNLYKSVDSYPIMFFPVVQA